MSSTDNLFTRIASRTVEDQLWPLYQKRLTESLIDDPSLFNISLLTKEEAQKELSGYCPGLGAIKINYPGTNFFRYRFLGELDERHGKYYQLPSSSSEDKVHAFFSEETKKTLSSLEQILIITEGEFKTIRMTNNTPSLPTIGLGGVNSICNVYKGRSRLIEPLGTLPRGKKVYIAFDYDPQDSDDTLASDSLKPRVAQAEKILAALLTLRGCQVFFIRLGSKERYSTSNLKVGLDDFLNLGGNIEEKINEAKIFQPSKADGFIYLLSSYLELSGKFIKVGSNFALCKNDFISTEANCKERYSPNQKDNPSKQVSCTTKFIESNYRTSIDTLVCNPGANSVITSNYEYNLWKGFATAPLEGDVSLWKDFVDLFFSDDPVIQHEFEAVMALSLQKPGIKQHRICILQSNMTGVGKSFYFETIAAIMNGKSRGGMSSDQQSVALVTSGVNLGRDFNSQLSGKKFIVFNEIGEKGERHTNSIKDLVTGTNIDINAKYQHARSEINYLTICITTNENYTHIISDTSRRELIYTIEENSGLAKKLVDYWDKADNPIRKWINTSIARSALMWYYLNYDLKGYDGSQRSPLNESKLKMAEASVRDIVLDIAEYIHSEMLVDSTDDLIPYVCPKLEMARFIQIYGGNKSVGKDFKAALKKVGYTYGSFDKTHSQIDMREISKNPHIKKPCVLILKGSPEPVRNDAMLYHYLENRYFGGKKI